MRIAICDSDINHSKIIKSIIYAYCNKKRIEILIDIYKDGEGLLSSRNNYGMIFLEYNLSGLNGLETAQILRKKDRSSLIVYISSSTNFIYDSFKVNTYRFLLKPIDKTKLLETLNDYFKIFTEAHPLWIKYKDETSCIKTGDIFYLEANNKYSFVSLEKEKLPCNKTMAKVYEKLPKVEFCKINRAYIVNMSYINRYSNDYVILKNNETLHISRKYISSFKENFKNFLDPLIP